MQQRQSLLKYYLTSFVAGSMLWFSPAFGQDNELLTLDSDAPPPEYSAPMAPDTTLEESVTTIPQETVTPETETNIDTVTDTETNTDITQSTEQAEPVIEPDTSPASEGGFVPSFGEFTNSLMFEPADLEKFLALIEKIEKRKPSGTTLSDKQLTELLEKPEAIAEVIEEEPIIFPYYHLASIVYGSPKHWMVRVNGITITPKNNLAENELYVTSVNDKVASFIWRPQDKRLLNALADIKPDMLEAEHAQTITHRVNRKGYTPRLFSEDGYAQFTLEPNQLFYSEYMTIYEGSVAQIVPPPPAPEIEETLQDTEVSEEGNGQRRSLEEATAPTEENFPILGILPEPPKRSIITEPPARQQ